jgi:hypothetical protein
MQYPAGSVMEWLHRLLARLGIGTATTGASARAPFYKPYAEEHVNFLYNLLFCDDPALFKGKEPTKAGDPSGILLAEPPDLAALATLAADLAQEGRTRALAYRRLQAAGAPVPSRQVLGVIVEFPQARGLDVLAAFSEGGVRYLNQSGKVAIFDGPGLPVEALAKELVAMAQPVVDRIGPWDKVRRPPPAAGRVRITFLVSDGLYFGEGPMAVFERDPMAAPVLAKAAQLLKRSIEVAMR